MSASRRKEVQFTVAIHCHWCGHNGASMWEETKTGRQLVSVEGFFERLGRKAPYPIETVCNNCGQIQRA